MPTEKPKVFLCYARNDQDRVEALYQKLSDAGFVPWMDSKDILPGEDWKQVLIKTIREAPFFLACLSNNSVNKRGVIQEEIREALDAWRQKVESDIYFIPVRLEECLVPEPLAKFQWVNLFSENDFKWLVQGLSAGMERLGVVQPIRLRSEPIDDLSEEVVKKMLQDNDFFHKDWYWMGKGVPHEYEEIARHSKRLVVDHTTGLAWQQSESQGQLRFKEARKYVHSLNDQRFAGYTDWRLPTLEEVMSLMEPKKNKQGMYIDPIFDSKQTYIWTADRSASGVWVVSFGDGGCNDGRVSGGGDCVRAVR